MTPEQIAEFKALAQDYKNKSDQILALVAIAEHGYQSDQDAINAAVSAKIGAAIAALN